MLLLEGHKKGQTVRFVAFTPDGQILISASNDGTTLLWDLSNQNSYQFLDQQRPYYSNVTLSPDGETLAWVSNANTITLRQRSTGQGRTLQPPGWACRLRFSPDGRFLAATGSGMHFWDLRTDEERLLEPPSIVSGHMAFSAPAFSPCGALLAVSSIDTFVRRSRGEAHIRLVSVTTGAEPSRLKGHGGCATDLAFSPDGTVLAATCGQFLWGWNVAEGRPLLREKVGNRHFQSVAFTPDGRFLAATCNDETVRFWDAQTWRQQAAFDWEIGPLVSLAIAADGMRAAAGSRKGKIVVWDVDL